MNYESYLKLDQILGAQKLESDAHGRHAHDEMLFITIHQTYELWFQQIIYELDSVLNVFTQPVVAEEQMGRIVSRLVRMNEIMRVLIEQVNILETMTPMDFLDFRDLIYSASGFQSFQFRLLENKLGLLSDKRINYNSLPYYAALSKEKAEVVKKAEDSPSLFDCLEKWLARTPFLEMKGFSFWESYKEAAYLMFDQDESFIDKQTQLNDHERSALRKNIDSSRETFQSLFNEGAYNDMRNKGLWRLNYKAVHAALLIQLYRDQPVFQLPFRLITEVLNLDSNLTQWRYRHTLMVRRMLGSRIGTGGSSGVQYLQTSADKHKIFDDFFKLTTFFIPSSRLPEIPEKFLAQLGFAFRE